ncbi:MAG: PD-(D/E)XK nuclease family protein [Erysipelotrichaceae bacterium]|nr:PD-(D/E)XK nuclease family protein [Erysipelotrichaceae bacterium]
MAQQIILADGYLHGTIYRQLLQLHDTNALTDVRVLPLRIYLQQLAQFEPETANLAARIKAVLEEHKEEFPIFFSMFDYPDFIRQVQSFHEDMTAYQIPLSSLPENDATQKELKQIQQYIQDLPASFDLLTELHSMNIDCSNVKYVSSAYGNYADTLYEDWLKSHNAQEYDYPVTLNLPMVSAKKALNARTELEACIQEIITRNLPLDETTVVLCNYEQQYPVWKRLCKQYGLPYVTTCGTTDSSVVLSYCNLVRFLTENSNTAAYEAVCSPWFHHPYKRELAEYIFQFYFTSKELLQPFTHCRTILSPLLNNPDTKDTYRNFNIYLDLEQKAEQARQAFTESLVYGENVYETAYNTLADSIYKNNETERQAFYDIKEYLENNPDLLHDETRTETVLSHIRSIRIAENHNTYGCLCVTDLSHKMFKRQYAYVLSLTQKNYPGFTAQSGIYEETWCAEIPQYPSKRKRHEKHMEDVSWIGQCANEITYSYPTNGFDGKAIEPTPMISELKHAEPWNFIQNDRPFRLDFRLQPKIAPVLFAPDGELSGSISSIEPWFACPFRYFLQSGLKIEENEYPQIETRIMGTVQHAIMEYLVKTYGKEYASQDISVLASLIADYFDPILPLFRRFQGLLKITRERLNEVMQEVLNYLQDMENDTEYKPAHTELRFGKNKNDISFSNGQITLHLRGIIDRLDLRNDNFRIIDYKSSAHALSVADVNKGLKLQLLTYLYTAMVLYPEKTPVGAYYFSMKPVHVSPDPCKLVRKKERYIDNTGDDAFFQEYRKSHQLQGWSFEEDPLLDFEGKHIVGLGKGGKPGKSQKPMHVREWAEDIYTTFLNNITEGNIGCTPVSQTPSTCTYCPYSAICRKQMIPTDSNIGQRNYFMKEDEGDNGNEVDE